jgi:predicted esterase
MSVRAQSVVTPTHGRVLIRDGNAAIALVGFHGYAQSAEDLMDALERVPGAEDFTLVSIQALHRFYTRGDQKIVASWMTRQDREQAIADNIDYVDRALEKETGTLFQKTVPISFLGFSQGVAMAYRAALLGRHPATTVVAIGGDIPPDVKNVSAERWPRVLIAAGANDQWYTAEKLEADAAFLSSHGVAHEIYRHDAGHEITADVLDAVALFIRGSARP